LQGITRRDVEAFWEAQDFDLGLRPYEGNCDLCFLKGRGTIKALIRERPSSAEWWASQEAAVKGSFCKDWTYGGLAGEVHEQPHMFDELPDDEQDAECGTWCGGDE
jgi:hypothetical protein